MGKRVKAGGGGESRKMGEGGEEEIGIFSLKGARRVR